jgi:predicted nucleic acid-binding protein
MINIKANSIDEIIYILKENGIETNDLLILVNGIEHSLIKEKHINDNDIVTIASIVHGG